jgi:hypothetical protein
MARKRSTQPKKSEESENSLDPLREKLEKGLQLAAWIEAAIEHREDFAPEVVATVIQDYHRQYDELQPELVGLAEEAATERSRLAEAAGQLEEAAAAIEAQVDEFKLRRVIGELSETDFEARVEEVRATVDASALPAAQEAIAEIDGLLSEVGAVQNRVRVASGEPEAPAPPAEEEPAAAEEAPVPEPGPDELGEEAYHAGGGENVADEWDVEPPAEPAPEPDVDTPPDLAGVSATGEDLMATGVIQAQPDLADAPPVHNTAEFSAKPPPPGEGPRLACTPPDGDEVIYPFTGDVMSLGRGRNNDIQIKNDGKISRYHCRIFRRGDEFIVEDNKSSNGTLVDGKLVTRQRLEGGELVQLGETRVRFYIT